MLSARTDSSYMAPSGAYAYVLPTPSRSGMLGLPTPAGTPSTRQLVTPASLQRTGSFGDGPGSFMLPLPSAFPGLPVSHAPLSDAETNLPLELDPNAPVGRKGWPLKYVYDMAVGFYAMRRHEDAGMKRPVAFEAAFGRKFNSSTFSDNWRAFDAADKVDGEIQRWVSHYHNAPGEWSLFMREWKQDRKTRR